MKLNSTIYNKLIAQAEEAREQGLEKLADAILDVVEEPLGGEAASYSYKELEEDIHKDLWTIASRLAFYYDLNSLDAKAIDQTIVRWAAKLTEDLEKSMGVEGIISPVEPKVPGEE